MPKISVIVPIYNVERYLPRCIESILNQTFQDFELILVNDGSCDGSGKICDEYANMDSRVRVIHKQNAGVSAARNTGMSIATGKYIMFVDSDDNIDKEMLSDMIVYDGSDIILSGLRYVDKKGNVIKEYTAQELQEIGLCDFIKKYYIKLDNEYILAGPYNKLYRKDIIDKNQLRYDEKISICEDGLFVVDFLGKCQKVSAVSKVYYNYVQYQGSTLMSQYNSNAIEACELLYLAKYNLLQSCGIIDQEIYQWLEERSFNTFIAFFFQIYTRSGLKKLQKWLKSKEALRNPSFIKLIKSCKNYDAKSLLFKFCVYTKSVFLIYFVLMIHFSLRKQ